MQKFLNMLGMSCYSCSAKFGFLKKEIGCEVCGFAFCQKCCKKREIPSEDDTRKQKLTCSNCYQHLTGNKPSIQETSPPLAHKKRMEAFKKQSYSVDSAGAMSGLKTQWSNEKDREIAERLQKLKRERIKDDLPSEMEIEERLAKLKGMDPSKYKAPPIQVYRPSYRRTSVEQADDLMMQVTEEVQLDSKLIKPEDEIAARLARLRDEVAEKMEVEEKISTEQDASQNEIDLEKSHSTFQSESELLSKLASKEVKEVVTDPEYQKMISSMQHSKETEHESDEEQEANKLVEKLMASNIDDEELESFNGQETEKTEEDSTEEEFPWCVICTEDAKMRCFGCDGDLYCIRCFKECHDSLDIKDHKTCPYLSPKKPLI